MRPPSEHGGSQYADTGNVGIDDALPSSRPPSGHDVHRASLLVCAHSADACEARATMEMLGLL